MKLLFVKYTLKIICYNMYCTFSTVKKKIYIFISKFETNSVQFGMHCSIQRNSYVLVTSKIFCLLKNIKTEEGHLK